LKVFSIFVIKKLETIDSFEISYQTNLNFKEKLSIFFYPYFDRDQDLKNNDEDDSNLPSEEKIWSK
jgi:hypothetical protein